MPLHIAFFKDLKKDDTHLAGGKGASLGEMTRSHIPVPQGFVITAKAFDRFLQESDLDVEIEAQLDKVNYKDINSVELASETIRDLIHDEKMPKDLTVEINNAYKKLQSEFGTEKNFFVAVRSSATAEDSSVASWAGELESYLNTTKKNLIGNVKKCWSSLFTPRAIMYRNEKGLRNTKVSVAVVVQKMVNSEISGISFTVHPVTKDKNQMIIEAGFGLGEAIVSGRITPDAYVIHKDDLSILDINISEQEKMLIRKPVGGNIWKKVSHEKKGNQKLAGRQIMEIAKICLQIEKHYGKPQDIEWAYEAGKFYIVQSRPITTL